ncbi:MAG: hypothetical protein JSR46_07170 [Verrucomicrobia bacterium]|nr:hypothetical protein [Verrucomicrobiota bacterium]
MSVQGAQTTPDAQTEEHLRIYSELSNEVLSSKAQAANEEISWFQTPSSRSVFYKHILLHSTREYKTLDETVKRIWGTCWKTALIALTQIAPEASYKDKNEAICFTATATAQFIDLETDQYSDVKRGLVNLKQTLQTPLEKGKGFAVLCNLYCGTHAFVIEKRSEEHCIIYQSYLEDGDEEGSYTFDGFLADEKKHVLWKTEEIVKALSNTLSPLQPVAERIENYQKLFFRPFSAKEFTIWDSTIFGHPRHRSPFLFVSTEPYLLRA